MRHHLLLLTSTLLWMILIGCSTSNALPNTVTAQKSRPQPLLLFQKTPCLGTCPAYNAMVYENGSIRFVEFRNALAQDTLQLQLPNEQLQQLKKEIEKLNYKELQNNYPSGWSDISATHLTFYEAGKEVKRLKHEEGGPQELINFQEWLHELIWQLAEEKKRPTY